jgi:hypothetical protein
LFGLVFAKTRIVATLRMHGLTIHYR